MKRMKRCGVAMLAVGLAACDMDLTDPNVPPEDLVITSPAGIRQIAIGLQAEYGNQLIEPINTVGLVTNEIGAIPQAFESYRRTDAGDIVTGADGPSTGPWGGHFRVIRTADELLEHAPTVVPEPGVASGIIALAKLYKAIAFGNLFQIYERVPVNVGTQIPDPVFASRPEVIAEVLRLLNEARQQLATTPPSSVFNTQVLAPGFDLPNTIDAMLARFHLIAGNLDEALAAAQRVDLTVLSEQRFSTADVNPLWNQWYNSGNAFLMRAKQSFRLEAEPGDGRVAFWVSPDTIIGVTERMDHIERYRTSSASFPIYLPGEMRLIIAEVHARQGRLDDARNWVNQVRTQCTSPVAEPLACLPARTAAELPTQQAILDEILRQRRYELYLQGLRWSDLRRFGAPMKYPFMPVPVTECDRNANAPQEVCQPVGA